MNEYERDMNECLNQQFDTIRKEMQQQGKSEKEIEKELNNLWRSIYGFD